MAEWMTSVELMNKMGFYSSTKNGNKSLAAIVTNYHANHPFPEGTVMKVGGNLLFSDAVLENETITSYLRLRGMYGKNRRHDIYLSEDEATLEKANNIPVPVELTEIDPEQYESLFSRISGDYSDFCIKAMDIYLHDWESQVDTITKRLSYLYSGDISSLPRILHELHDDVERLAGVSFEKLKNGKEDSTIKCIRRDKRLQYYFLRAAREMGMRNGVIYLESV